MRAPFKGPRMITTSTPTRQHGQGWQAEMASAITSARELVNELGLDPELIRGADAAGAAFRLRVPRSYVARIQRGIRCTWSTSPGASALKSPAATFCPVIATTLPGVHVPVTVAGAAGQSG